MSRVGAPRLRPRRPFVCVGCVGGAGLRLLRGAWVDSVCGFWAGLGVLWCWLGGALVLAWGCFGAGLGVLWAGLGVLWAGFGVAGACVVIPCLRSYACWPGLGSVGGIATIGAALRRVVGVSVVYGRKIPRVVAWMGQGRVPVEGSMVAKPPGGCSKCSRPRWYAGDMGCLGCSGRRFGRAGSWRGGFCGAAGWACPSFVCAAGMIEPTVGA